MKQGSKEASGGLPPAEFAQVGKRMRVERFASAEFVGEVSSRFEIADIDSAVLWLINPANATETIHWGRNFLYGTHLETAAGSINVVVKQFRNSGLRNRLRRFFSGSKAARSWRTARAFELAGLKTAEAVMLIESRQPEGPSFFVTRHLEGVIEARYLLRAANSRQEKETFPDLAFEAFLNALGKAICRMHQAGFFHRDLSIGNVLMPDDAKAPTAEDLAIIDLNRARHPCHLNLWQKNRDLCRLAIRRPEQQELFLRSYWNTESLRWYQLALYRAYHHGFRLRIDLKNGLRSWIRGIGKWLLPRRAHAHIPEAPTNASIRDKIVWDHLSDQPHQHAGKLEKLWVRVTDAPRQARYTAAFISSSPRVFQSYRRLHRDLYRNPVPWGGVGICVRPLAEAPDRLLAAIAELNVQHVLVRLHPWEDDHRAEEHLARSLVELGCEVAFSLPQNRGLVRDPARWNQKVAELAERFTPFGRHFQIGQAINRSKWGVWRYSEYQSMAWSAAEILRKYPGVEILGPAVIDFELHVTSAILNAKYKRLHFDILAGLLYVDRRGAPENTQLGFATIDKILLQQAIAETAKSCGPRSWVTEVNWPLWEGPHSPAGKAVSVDQESQADYLVRYYLLALATGAVERVYWWQLLARGYGLAFVRDGANSDGVELVKRPSFFALRTLSEELRHSVFLRPLSSPPGTHLYLFRTRLGRELIAGWSTDGPKRVTLHTSASRIVDRDGKSSTPPPSREIELSSSVRYFHL